MKLQNLGLGALVGTLLLAPMIALMYFMEKWVDLSFTPFDVFDWIARILPGPVVTFGIDLMIDTLLFFGASVSGTAKTAEQIMGVALFFIAGVISTILIFVYIERRDTGRGTNFGFLLGLLFGIPIALITATIGQSSLGSMINFTWVLVLFLSWGVLVVEVGRRVVARRSIEAVSGDEETSEERSVDVIGRRQFLVRMGLATATITVAGSGLGRVLAVNERKQLEAELEAMSAKMPELSPMVELPNADDPVAPAPGTRPEYTAIRDHYKVFIRSQPTRIEESTWTLPIIGLVDNPMVMTLDDIRNNYESRSQFITLTCISGRVGTDLISTTHWTGVSLQDILADVAPQANARYLHITCGDGFYETVDLDLINSDERIMLAYAWDGRPIPFDHGFPLRIWLPDRYGMKQPKWITGIEVVEEYREGYWVERGWDEVARIKTTSVVDTVAVDSVIEDGDMKLVPVGGIAFAGAKGISKVEVRVDGAGPWHEARLRSPLSDTTWVIWRYDWPFDEGRHTFQVRTVEADGTPQIEEDSPPRPDGSSGIHAKTEWLFKA